MGRGGIQKWNHRKGHPLFKLEEETKASCQGSRMMDVPEGTRSLNGNDMVKVAR